MHLIDVKFIWVCLIFIGFDIVTGVFKAVKTDSWSSEKMRKGLTTKAGTLLIIAFLVALDVAQCMVDLQLNAHITNTGCAFVTFMNIGSCVENFNEALPGLLPPQITKMLATAASAAGVEKTE